jgi:hypothetical protein
MGQIQATAQYDCIQVTAVPHDLYYHVVMHESALTEIHLPYALVHEGTVVIRKIGAATEMTTLQQ